jgi:hypothetical protein
LNVFFGFDSNLKMGNDDVNKKYDRSQIRQS